MSPPPDLLWVKEPHGDAEPVELPHRRAYAKRCYDAIKAAAGAQGWQSRETMFYRQFGDTFQMPTLRFASNRNETWIEWRMKPMALDPIYWDIVGVDARRWRVASRATKVVALSVPVFDTVAWEDTPLTPEENAEVILDRLAELSRAAVPSYADALRQHPDRNRYLTLEAVALLHENRAPEALHLLDAVASGAIIPRHTYNFTTQTGERDSLDLIRASMSTP